MNLKENSDFKFPKNERLSGKRLIDELFEKGASQYLYPFRILCLKEIRREEGKYPKVLFSISKKNFKRAVDRNKIKRQLKEAYRKNKKAIFYDSGETLIPEFLAILYTSKEKLPFNKLEEKLILILKRCKTISS